MRYKIIKQSPLDDRLFILEDKNGKQFNVDFYTGGEVEPPVGANETEDSWNSWLKSFEGKEIDIEEIIPFTYFTSGKVSVKEV